MLAIVTLFVLVMLGCVVLPMWLLEYLKWVSIIATLVVVAAFVAMTVEYMRKEEKETRKRN